jgi:large subunit ribosomal protein L4
MTNVAVKTLAGKDNGSVELDAATFGIQPNVPVMHQVVTAQLARRRAGTQSTKTRAEVAGGGAKPFKQKGTGNARQGSTRAPHFSGGGVALGPKPRKYGQKTPKKMIKLALRSALSDRANEGKVLVVEGWDFDTPKTKDAVAALAALGIDGKALVVIERDDVAAAKSFRNLPGVQLLEVGELNAYDVLCNEYIVFSTATLPTASGETAEVEAAPAKAKRAPAKKAPAKKAPAKKAAAEKAGFVEAPEDGSQPKGYPIKGNADSMLYHVPGSAFYDRTVAEVWFATEEAAEAAGYSKPKSQQHDDAETVDSETVATETEESE